MLEFADINIERCAAQMIALESVGEALETAQTGAAMKMLVAPNGVVA